MSQNGDDIRKGGPGRIGVNEPLSQLPKGQDRATRASQNRMRHRVEEETGETARGMVHDPEGHPGNRAWGHSLEDGGSNH